MNKFLRLCLFIFAACLTISCSKPVLLAEGIGGTGKVQEGLGGTGKIAQEGIGGTGQIAQEGIGGTGKTLQEGIGGTGIVGTITGFGSIWVNKAHVHFDSKTPVTINQQPAKSSDFKIGHVVSLMSDKQRHGYQARSVDIVHEVVGPIKALSKDQISLLGQTIKLDQRSLIFKGAESQTFAQLKLHDWVSVSGYRKPSGEVLATRLDVIEPQSTVELIGPIKESDGAQSIFGQPIQIDQLLADASDIVQPNSPRRVLVVGRYEDGLIKVERIETDSIQAVIEEASELVWEGFIQEWDDDFYLNGIEFDLEDAFEFDEDELLILEGTLEDDEFVLDEFYEAQEEFEFDEDFDHDEFEDVEDHEEFEEVEEFEEGFEEDFEEDFEEFDDIEDEFEEFEEDFEEFEPEDEDYEE
ncbi:MAG: DUF5666 domain-containing protein [Pseudomonadales bacterium]|nr:DUF5666 domain-containing protein [Pseudomonadales bacterium]